VIGQTISHYKILEKLGEGGMGVVYKARDTKLDRVVALKFLPPTLLSSESEVSRFEQEAKAISALNDPRIATIHDILDVEGERFLVLEYLPGGTLKTKLKILMEAGHEFSADEVIDFGVQLAEGLAHAHRKGIIHRDIKTDNIMLTEDGKLKITDFGLAKLKGGVHITRSGSTVGTAAYMSPEQIRAGEIDNRSDLFSAGVVLYELATGRLPFRGEHEASLAYSIANEDPIPPKTLRPSMPSGLDHVIRRCL
jgi:serine/threonine protein kinase